MRFSRLIGLFAALVMAATLTAFVPSSAQAAPARQPHNMSNVKAAEIRDTGKFYAGGRIKTYRNKVVYLQKKATKRAPWKPFKSSKSNARGGFRITFDGPVGSCYRVVAGPTPRNKTARKVVGCIIRA